ncbi:type III-A CRISPR-associated RAMP protein Csm3 [Anaerohalosphaeraceae bacterium U12dextr]
MKLIKTKKITGKVLVKTGLHIGGGDAAMEIGGMDNPIIRNPATKEPYIPGSSLKGKMRSLLEWYKDKVDLKENVHHCNDTITALDCPICRVFGISASEKTEIGPTRLIIRDCPLSEMFSQKFKKGYPIIEDKSENTINRITAKATPRPIERVVPDVTFDLNISFKILDMGDGGVKDEENFSQVVLLGLALVQDDYLGGGGSRGNGRIQFIELKDENENEIKLPLIREKSTR